MTLASCINASSLNASLTRIIEQSLSIPTTSRLNDAPRDCLRLLACTSGGWFQVRCAAGASEAIRRARSRIVVPYPSAADDRAHHRSMKAFN
jgi:hypothetical protein